MAPDTPLLSIQKPRNILCDDEGNIRIADFGLAIGRTETNPKLINYVVTRWYRAPELLLECKGYDGGVDVWAIGCILGEMLARKPLFRGGNGASGPQHGENEEKQLSLSMHLSMPQCVTSDSQMC